MPLGLGTQWPREMKKTKKKNPPVGKASGGSRTGNLTHILSFRELESGTWSVPR